MRVFVAGPGRCGTVTFAKACKHVTNYTAAHERQRGLNPPWTTPDGHIEVDPRLTWHARSLVSEYPESLWVILDRDRDRTALSFARRATTMTAWRRLSTYDAPNAVLGAMHYVEFIYDYLDMAIPKDRRLWLTTPVSESEARMFWDRIGAEGDFGKFAAALGQVHNASR